MKRNKKKYNIYSMREKEFNIIGLSHNQTSIGSFVVVLSEKDGDEKIPVIVKSSDATNITNAINDDEIKKSSIYDLVRSMTKHFLITLEKIEIYDVLEGLFYVKLKFTKGNEEIYLDCSIGDSLVLSAVYSMSIVVSKKVSDNYAIILNEDGSVEIPKKEPTEVLEESIEKLESLIKEALEGEEYEKAAQLRDEIEVLKGN
jgi:bifunctional DNase/RNase|tara:strand:- start:56 stop:658 length:603 start_codon:yes stop_codon:yes gene_type:complete